MIKWNGGNGHFNLMGGVGYSNNAIFTLELNTHKENYNDLGKR